MLKSCSPSLWSVIRKQITASKARTGLIVETLLFMFFQLITLMGNACYRYTARLDITQRSMTSQLHTNTKLSNYTLMPLTVVQCVCDVTTHS